MSHSLDMLITSSSRPELFPYMWESFKKMVTFRGNLRVIVHEDFVIEKESKKVLDFLNDLKEKGEIHEIYSHKPALGLGLVMDEMFKTKIRSKYMLYFQEDWEVERPIDLDEILWVMDENKCINQIVFNKIHNTASLNGASQIQFTYSGLKTCLYHSWSFMPSIWRMDHVRKWWRVRNQRPEGYFTNAFGSHEERMDCEYCRSKIGSYLYGPTGDWRFVRHIGNDWRMADWRMESGNPGGCHDKSRMDDPYRAPWVPHTKRPTFKNYTNEEQVNMQMNEEPVEAR